jgi:hypothetical protein
MRRRIDRTIFYKPKGNMAEGERKRRKRREEPDPNRKVGPSGPPAGLVQDIEDARRDRLTDEEAPALVAALRAGDDDARKQLQNKLRFLIYQDHHGRPLDPFEVTKPKALSHLAVRTMAIAVALDRLKRNDEIDVISFVEAEVNRAFFDQRRQDSDSIVVPRSTNRTREVNGQEPHQSLQRVRVKQQRPDEDDYQVPSPLEIGPTDTIHRIPVVNPEPTPMPHENAIADEITEAVAHDDFERDVLELLVDGYSTRQIAATLATTKPKIETVVKRFRKRAEKFDRELAGDDD